MTAPATPLIVPAGVPKEELAKFAAANAALNIVWVVPGTSSVGSTSALADAQTAQAAADYHRETVTAWCDTIEDVLGYAKEASLVVPIPVLPMVLTLLKGGTAMARSLLLKEPAVERWPLARLEAEPAAARPLA